MPDSLLSRFDLLFVILDTSEPENDRKIADRVIRNHRYRDPSQQDGEAIQIDNEADRKRSKIVFKNLAIWSRDQFFDKIEIRDSQIVPWLIAVSTVYKLI